MALVALVSVACTGRLPGPIECEKMATRLVGESARTISESPGKKRFVGIVTHGCLTTPFDRQAVRCIEESRSLPRCMEELAWRAPERKPALERFMHRALK